MKIIIIKALREIILKFFTVLFFAGIIFSITLIEPKTASAQATCRYIGQCVNNKKCICPPNVSPVWCYRGEVDPIPGDVDCGSAIIGGVEPPGSVAAMNAESGGEIGLIFFASRAINLANIVAGILVMINFVFAGFLYISGAGSASNMTKINERMMWSVVGILVIVSSYTLAAIFGLVFYGDPTFIINPTLTGAVN